MMINKNFIERIQNLKPFITEGRRVAGYYSTSMGHYVVTRCHRGGDHETVLAMDLATGRGLVTRSFVPFLKRYPLRYGNSLGVREQLDTDSGLESWVRASSAKLREDGNVAFLRTTFSYANFAKHFAIAEDGVVYRKRDDIRGVVYNGRLRRRSEFLFDGAGDPIPKRSATTFTVPEYFSDEQRSVVLRKSAVRKTVTLLGQELPETVAKSVRRDKVIDRRNNSYHNRPDPKFQKVRNQDDVNPNYQYYGIELEVSSRSAWSPPGLAKELRNAKMIQQWKNDCTIEGGGFEVVTQPVTWEYLMQKREWVESMLLKLQETGHESSSAVNTGLHVNLSRDRFGVGTELSTAEHITHFGVLLHRLQKELFPLTGRTERTLNRWAPFEAGNSGRGLKNWSEVLYDQLNRGWSAGSPHGDRGALNMQHRNRIELRLSQGTIDPDEFFTRVGIAYALMEQSKRFEEYTEILDTKRAVLFEQFNSMLQSEVNICV